MTYGRIMLNTKILQLPSLSLTHTHTHTFRASQNPPTELQDVPIEATSKSIVMHHMTLGQTCL